MVSIGCIRCENFRRDIVARTFALIAPIWPDLHRVLCSNKIVQMHPKHYETQKNMSFGSIAWIRCICCEKFRRDFVARTFALIALIRRDLHEVSYSNEMVPNAPKHYETQQKMSFGSNGVDWVRLFWKHLTRLCGTKFCINCTSSAHFALSLLP